jgi:hypothetical protein
LGRTTVASTVVVEAEAEAMATCGGGGQVLVRLAARWCWSGRLRALPADQQTGRAPCRAHTQAARLQGVLIPQASAHIPFEGCCMLV